MGNYSSGDITPLPAGVDDLEHVYDATDLSAVSSNDNSTYVGQQASGEYAIHMFKDTVTGTSVDLTWSGKSSLAPSTSPVKLQVYKVSTTTWEDAPGAGAMNNTAAADTDFDLTSTIPDTTNYLSGGVLTCRVYQYYQAEGTLVTIGANTGNSGDIQDNDFDSAETTENYGGRTSWIIGSTDGSRKRHAIIRPILSSIPAGSTIVSASLHLYVTADQGTNCTINVYKIADANADWAEGTQTGSAQENMSCWSYKIYSSGTPTNWAGAAGCSTAGTDYVNTSLGSVVHTTGTTGYIEIVFNASGLAVIQDWFGDASNNGFILIGTLAANTFTTIDSSESTTDGRRPYLSVTYMPSVLLGGNLLTDGDMELDNLTNWTDIGTPTTKAKNTSSPIAGVRDLHLVSDESNDGARHFCGVTAGKWYRVGATMKVSSGSANIIAYDDTANIALAAQNVNPETATAYKASGISLHTEASYGAFITTSFTAASEWYVDDAYIKEITKASLFTEQRNSGSADVAEASVEVTHPRFFEAPCGVAICMDANDPTKYILGVVARNAGYQEFVRLYTVDGTTVTKVLEEAVTYVAGQRVKLVKSGTDVSLYYNNVQKGATQTIAGYTGTIHALFNSDDDNNLGAFTLPSPA